MKTIRQRSGAYSRAIITWMANAAGDSCPLIKSFYLAAAAVLTINGMPFSSLSPLRESTQQLWNGMGSIHRCWTRRRNSEKQHGARHRTTNSLNRGEATVRCSGHGSRRGGREVAGPGSEGNTLQCSLAKLS
jgi:hypothetical protein